MSAAQLIVRAAALYNLSGAAIFLTPGALELLGIAPPAALWLWLPSIFGCFVAVFAFDQGSVGSFIIWLALGDLVLAVATVASVKVATQRTHRQLLTNTQMLGMKCRVQYRPFSARPYDLGSSGA